MKDKKLVNGIKAIKNKKAKLNRLNLDWNQLRADKFNK